MNPVIHGLARNLVTNELLSEASVQELLAESRQTGNTLLTTLLSRNAVSPAAIASLTAREFALPLLDLAAYDKQQFLPRLVDPRLIRKHQMLPLFRRGDSLNLALADPTYTAGIDEIRFHTGLSIDLIVVEQDKLSRVIHRLLDFYQATEQDDSISRGTQNQTVELEIIRDPEAGEQISTADEASLVSYVNRVMLDAIQHGASDIHIEPYEKTCRLRFRIDGILHEVNRPPIHVAARIASRIKVMSQMDITEKRVPQDGRIKLKLPRGSFIDVRCNTMPTLWGEKVVLRLFDPRCRQLEIGDLGMEPQQQQLYIDALHRAQGMVLVTGPTGCGKTITLYSGLKLLNTSARNISTAENPVEMALDGINQVQIKTRSGLNFATALRAFLRQDPDVVMVGEIRDRETADMAVKAAQTGHLLLSTLHTNSAAETLSRLRNMGVEAYNLATSVSLIIAQRLVRRLCDQCKESARFSENTLRAAGFTPTELGGLKTCRARGCGHCTGGYRGRIGIYEVVPINENISRIIMDDGNSLQIENQIRQEGCASLRRSALNKVALGLTSLDEANRLT